MSKHKQKQQQQQQDEQTAPAPAPVLVPDQQPKAKRGLAATMARYRGNYVDGRCGDAVSARLAGLSLEAILAEANQASGLPPGTLEARYAGLNPGQRRMNAGNRIRAAAKRAVAAEIAALIPKGQ